MVDPLGLQAVYGQNMIPDRTVNPLAESRYLTLNFHMSFYTQYGERMYQKESEERRLQQLLRANAKSYAASTGNGATFYGTDAQNLYSIFASGDGFFKGHNFVYYERLESQGSNEIFSLIPGFFGFYYTGDVNRTDKRHSIALNLQQNEGRNWYGPGGQINWTLGLGATTLEGSSSTFRLFSRDFGFSPWVYSKSYPASPYFNRYMLSTVGKSLGYLSAGIGLIMDGIGVWNYYQNPNSANAVHPGKAGLNTVMSAYGLFINPAAAILYFGVDAFYPGGWPGAAAQSAKLEAREHAMNGHSFFSNSAYKQ